MRKIVTVFTLFTVILTSCQEVKVTDGLYDLQFDELATVWDEAIPLGNATVGALVWQRDSALRFSLDRIDLWDLRPTATLTSYEYNFEWLFSSWKSGNYDRVQKQLDEPYESHPAPSKIPGAAMEFDISSMGEVASVRLHLKEALCRVIWESGAELNTFIHPTLPIGWFKAKGVDEAFIPNIIAPAYDGGLSSLGYTKGKVKESGSTITYHQKGYGGFFYDVKVEYQQTGDEITGLWSITSSLKKDNVDQIIELALKRGFETDYSTNCTWWGEYWSRSSLEVPDKAIARQYALDIYKLGCVTREDSYPISLQAIWTADDGSLPPWKGDYHHDLNTQMSHIPTYTANRLKEGQGFLRTLALQRPKHREYTKGYFGVEGLNMPGVTDLLGNPMGGWAQYAMSPTIAAWMSHHFYMYWKYSNDAKYMYFTVLPYMKEVATFLDNFMYEDSEGVLQLPLSSSPEIYNNSPEAWFEDMTNYDLALVRFVFEKTAELCELVSSKEEAKYWQSRLAILPQYDLDEIGALTFAPGHPYDESHRHLANAMAIYPLSLLDVNNSPKEREIIKATINKIEEAGSAEWVGYSFSWLAALKARNRDGQGASEALSDFANCFVLKNSFHANGDQSGTGKSGLEYRPFTLEGNMLYAAALQEMLLQSHTGVVDIFPAVPFEWEDVSFTDFRAMGGIVVSAQREGGRIKMIKLVPESWNAIKLRNNFGDIRPQRVVGGELSLSSDGRMYNIEVTMNQPVVLYF